MASWWTKWASGTWINLTGTVADVEAVFRTEIHDYLVDGELHHANADEPSIPAALAGLVAGPVSPHDFRSAPAGRFSLPDTEMSNGAHWLCPAHRDDLRRHPPPRGRARREWADDRGRRAHQHHGG